MFLKERFLKKCECGCDRQKLRCSAEVRADQLLKCECACATQQNLSQPNVWYFPFKKFFMKCPIDGLISKGFSFWFKTSQNRCQKLSWALTIYLKRRWSGHTVQEWIYNGHKLPRTFFTFPHWYMMGTI